MAREIPAELEEWQKLGWIAPVDDANYDRQLELRIESEWLVAQQKILQENLRNASSAISTE